jgi:CheY-like chemotaxis protein
LPSFPKAGFFMALVLSTGVDKALLKTRRLILESAGHKVATVMDETALLVACKEHSFDVAVIGQTVSANFKRRACTLIRQHCPAAKILELYPPHMGRVLDDADSWLVVPAEAPQELAERVDELARKKNAE